MLSDAMISVIRLKVLYVSVLLMFYLSARLFRPFSPFIYRVAFKCSDVLFCAMRVMFPHTHVF